MLTSDAMKKVIIGAALATMLVAPAVAQSYSASYGSGNVINLPQTQKGNGAAGTGAGAYSGAGDYAFAPSGSSAFSYAARSRTEMRTPISGPQDLSIRSQN